MLVVFDYITESSPFFNSLKIATALERKLYSKNGLFKE